MIGEVLTIKIKEYWVGDGLGGHLGYNTYNLLGYWL